jgi:hypothetical protein
MNNNNNYILKGSDDGAMHFEESCFTTSSIVQCFSLKTFRKLALLPSSGKKGGRGGPVTLTLSKGPHRVGATPSPLFLPEDGSRASFRNVVFKEKTLDDG